MLQRIVLPVFCAILVAVLLFQPSPATAASGDSNGGNIAPVPVTDLSHTPAAPGKTPTIVIHPPEDDHRTPVARRHEVSDAVGVDVGEAGRGAAGESGQSGCVRAEGSGTDGQAGASDA